MKHKTITLLAISVLAATTAAMAQSSRPIAFDEALTMALSENPAMKAADHEIAATDAERRAAIGLRMPRVNLSGAYVHLGKDIGADFNHLKEPVGKAAQQILGSGLVPVEQIPSIQGLLTPILGADWSLTIQQRNFGFVGGEVTVPIWMGGRINAANRAARINVASAEAAREQSRAALISELVERYYGLALSRRVVEVRRRVVEGMGQHLKDAEALEASGMIAQSERLYVAFKLSEAERELSDARLEARTVAAALSNTLGCDADWQPVSAMFMIENIDPLVHFTSMAADRNPLLEQVEMKRRMAEEGVRVQRADFLPQVVAMGGGSLYNYQVAGFVPRWAVGVGVSIKLFDGLNREHKYSAARQTARRVEELQRKASNDITLLVEKLYNEMMNQRNRMSSIDASMRFAEEYVRIKRAAFREGMAPSTELIDAELNLAAIRTERLEAAYRFDLALARLLEAAGMSDSFAGYAARGRSIN